MSKLSMVMSAAVEAGMRTTTGHFAEAVIRQLGEEGALNCGVEKALALFDFTSSVTVSKASKARRRAASKATKTAKPDVLLPFCGVIVEDWCKGVRFNHGLHTQCTNGRQGAVRYCKTCAKSASSSASGKPANGDIEDRAPLGVDYRDPKGKRTVPFANVAEKMKLSIEEAKEAAAKMGWSIPGPQLVKREVRRGRPAKSAAASDTSSDSSSKKSVKVKRKKVAVKSQKDLIATLVASAAAEVLAPTKPTKVEKEAAKAAKLAEKEAKTKAALRAKAAALVKKEAEKEAAKAAKVAEKEAAKAAKAAEKEAAKAAKLAEKEAAKAAKAAEKEAAKAAKAAEKEAAKAAKLAEKEAAKAAKVAEKEAAKIKKVVEEIRAFDICNDFTRAAGLEDVDIKELLSILKEAKNMNRKLERAEKKAAKVATANDAAQIEAEEDAAIIEHLGEQKVDAMSTMAAVSAELEAEEVEEEEELTLTSEMITEINGAKFYKVPHYAGYDNFLFTLEGEMFGIWDPETNEITEVEEE